MKYDNFKAVNENAEWISAKTRIDTKSTTDSAGLSRTKNNTKHMRSTPVGGKSTDVYKRATTNTANGNSTVTRLRSIIKPDNTYSNTNTAADGTITRTKGYDSIFKHRTPTIGGKT